MHTLFFYEYRQWSSHSDIIIALRVSNFVKFSFDFSEQFWKYAIISTENGKRIQLYDTENWHCIARLLFEPLDRLGKLALSVHPTAKFIFLTDYDAAVRFFFLFFSKDFK